ncbi:Uncharacterized conserved protein YlxW, UPF0749 family [Micromonospora phaseoli]|uniref:Uncharacterized conserved protein YlxW, UPF0749 family n=1 Tax=Micromonospora phaseoli TaxID=1144548 RepID=A0A1H6TX50_9ACTN|nr:DUF881 domain-containing protein [Micromonospora phaseoli]PZV98784.1 uncharacterized protein YlxW (UPF0749 family) [Micromonospora phaseoli]GIJ76466.1 membrane protein [Micromonospora phaseoli]SEI84658.1 Uncharacterized conserved protein YlxW, UPF0749 family [Micromonospora phaseoli]
MSDGSGEGRRSARAFTPDFLTELFRNPLDPGYADAAAQRAKTGRPARPGWSVGPVGLAVIVLLGFLCAVAYRQTMAEEPGRAQARSGLVAQIKQRQDETDVLSARADELRAEVNRQREAALGGSQAARLRDLEASTGLGRVRGDGVVVRLADAPKGQDVISGANVGPPQVLYLDLQAVANDLWSVGAEAIAINGQRLTATSTIRNAGEAILVDFRPVTGPYEVSAIGPGSMRERFDTSNSALTMRKVAQNTGISFDVRDADDLTLPAAPEPRLRYAEPAVSPSLSPSAEVEPSGSGTSPSPSGGG